MTDVANAGDGENASAPVAAKAAAEKGRGTYVL